MEVFVEDIWTSILPYNDCYMNIKFREVSKFYNVLIYKFITNLDNTLKFIRYIMMFLLN